MSSDYELSREEKTYEQWFPTFVRPRPSKFFFLQDGTGIIDARARYRAAALRLRNTEIE
jgi:hypothetical protein